MSNELKLPMAGVRERSDATMYNPDSRGYYWSSSPESTNGYYILFLSTYIEPVSSANQSSVQYITCHTVVLQ
ncbi:hypothetical protein ACFLY2_01095, partial [Patescibacteria group bacterium]